MSDPVRFLSDYRRANPKREDEGHADYKARTYEVWREEALDYADWMLLQGTEPNYREALTLVIEVLRTPRD